MFYHDEIDEIMERWRNKLVSQDDAMKRLEEIEKRAYLRIPDAEPDGDITFSVATAVDEILGR